MRKRCRAADQQPPGARCSHNQHIASQGGCALHRMPCTGTGSITHNAWPCYPIMIPHGLETPYHVTSRPMRPPRRLPGEPPSGLEEADDLGGEGGCGAVA
eukprot:3625780-Rhodomonas_salina.1